MLWTKRIIFVRWPLLRCAHCASCVVALLVPVVPAGATASPSNRLLFPLIPSLWLLTSPALIVDKYLLDEILNLLPFDFLRWKVFAMVSIYLIGDLFDLSPKCFLEWAWSWHWNSKCHCILVLSYFDIVKETLSVRFQEVLDYNCFVSYLQSYSIRSIVKGVDTECARIWLSLPLSLLHLVKSAICTWMLLWTAALVVTRWCDKESASTVWH